MKTSLYVHIPFCSSKCFYCSFPIVVGQGNHEKTYLQMLKKESCAYSSRKISTLYIGGGTPSCLSDTAINQLFLILRKQFDLSLCEEITFEVNPEQVTKEKSALLKSQGVNRISLGVQSFHTSRLQSLGRRHHSKDIVNAYQILRQSQFSNINCDLIFGFSDQTIDELDDDLNQMIQLHPEHISLYALTLEPRSLFFIKNIKINLEQQAEMYQRVLDFLAGHHFQQYEVSNFSKPGFESKHNIHYWTGGDYIGLGMGAHSHFNGKRFWNIDKFQEYLSQMSLHGIAIQETETLSLSTRLMERILFGLRMNQGVCVEAVEDDLKLSLPMEKKEKIQQFIQEGFLQQKGPWLQATSKGRLVLDSLAVALI